MLDNTNSSNFPGLIHISQNRWYVFGFNMPTGKSKHRATIYILKKTLKETQNFSKCWTLYLTPKANNTVKMNHILES